MAAAALIVRFATGHGAEPHAKRRRLAGDGEHGGGELQQQPQSSSSAIPLCLPTSSKATSPISHEAQMLRKALNYHHARVRSLVARCRAVSEETSRKMTGFALLRAQVAALESHISGSLHKSDDDVSAEFVRKLNDKVTQLIAQVDAMQQQLQDQVVPMDGVEEKREEKKEEEQVVQEVHECEFMAEDDLDELADIDVDVDVDAAHSKPVIVQEEEEEEEQQEEEQEEEVEGAVLDAQVAAQMEEDDDEVDLDSHSHQQQGQANDEPASAIPQCTSPLHSTAASFPVDAQSIETPPMPAEPTAAAPTAAAPSIEAWSLGVQQAIADVADTADAELRVNEPAESLATVAPIPSPSPPPPVDDTISPATTAQPAPKAAPRVPAPVTMVETPEAAALRLQALTSASAFLSAAPQPRAFSLRKSDPAPAPLPQPPPPPKPVVAGNMVPRCVRKATGAGGSKPGTPTTSEPRLTKAALDALLSRQSGK